MPERARPAAMGDDPTEIQAARTQARRRLVGAVVLLLIGVVGFPVLFETQPRPLPIDTPIETPRRDTVASGLTGKDVAPARSQPLPVLPVLPAEVAAEETPASAATAAPAPAPAPALSKVAPVVLAAAPVVVSPPVPAQASVAAASAGGAKASAPASKPAPVAAKPSAPPERPTAAASAAADAGRFVIQAGAYSEAGKLREARAKIEKLGLKTYTQVVESDKGSRTRVRVGPYATRAEADAVAEKVKRSGLPAVVLAL